MSRVLPQLPWSAKSFWSVRPYAFSVLCLSLAIMGVGDALLVRSELGSRPWTVLSQGLSLQTGVTIGTATAIISIITVIFWIPFRIKPGLGTICNISIIPIFIDLTLRFVTPSQNDTILGLFFVVLGTALIGINTAFYLTCKQGPGPRDGLMVGICEKFHIKISHARSILEVLACLGGWLLGGTVGIGTLIFALTIGWSIEITLNVFKKIYNV